MNPWSYSNERHEYCKSLGTDILGLGELHKNVQGREQFQGGNWICSQAAETKDGKCKDPSVGVAILLSNRMVRKVMSQGSVESRLQDHDSSPTETFGKRMSGVLQRLTSRIPTSQRVQEQHPAVKSVIRSNYKR